MHRAGAASPDESLAETNKVIPNSFRVFFVAVRGAETASLREELQPTETLQHTGGQPKPFSGVLHPRGHSKSHSSNSPPAWKSRPRGRKSTFLVPAIWW